LGFLFTFHFFDPSRGGEHFCRVEVRGTTKQREYYYDDGTLLDVIPINIIYIFNIAGSTQTSLMNP